MITDADAISPALREEALESLLLERGLVDTTTIETFIRTYETAVGPMNGAKVVAVLSAVYKDGPTIALSKSELESHDVVAFGQRVLTMAANAGKGWFAILVGKMIDHHTIIPDYILKAIFFAVFGDRVIPAFDEMTQIARRRFDRRDARHVRRGAPRQQTGGAIDAGMTEP